MGETEEEKIVLVVVVVVGAHCGVCDKSIFYLGDVPRYRIIWRVAASPELNEDTHVGAGGLLNDPGNSRSMSVNVEGARVDPLVAVVVRQRNRMVIWEGL